ncbi:MAG: T9SS type A sorting domain-containing protein, partial [Chitinophagaceae bacterium]
VVTYYSATGDYVSTNGFLGSDYTNGPLTVFQHLGSEGDNGVYRYGAPSGTLPTLSVGGNYWADVVFTNPVVSWPLNLTQITDNNGCSVTVNQLVNQTVNNPLPVSLTSFSAKLDQDNNVKLDWSTASESNNKGFEIIRSTDAAKWLSIGFVEGSGTSSLSRTYSLVDKNLSSGKYFYRLKQVDYDGKFNYSNIIAIDVNGKLAYTLNQSYPNPSYGASTITYSIPVKSKVTLTVYDVQGRVVRVLQNGERAAGKYAVTVPSDLLNTGIYYYKLEAGEFKSTRKMIVQ